jgi:uncharacterized FAD-dependent dehydrogenase
MNPCCEFERTKSYNFLVCQCENYKKKCYSFCDMCSENKFLRESSEAETNCNTSSESSDSSSFSEE